MYIVSLLVVSQYCIFSAFALIPTWRVVGSLAQADIGLLKTSIVSAFEKPLANIYTLGTQFIKSSFFLISSQI